MEIAEAIRQLRERQGLTQEAFASSIRFAYPTVNRWENGKAVPDGSSLRELLRHAERLGKEFQDVAATLAAASSGASASPAGAARRRGRKLAEPDYDALPSPTTGKLDLKAMEGMLWKAACSIRGEKDAPKFKDYILPLMFLKRLSDVFEDEIARLTAEYDDEKTARAVVEADHSVVRFYISEEALWPVLSGRRAFEWKEGREPKTVGERVTSTLRLVARLNARLQGVIDIVDFNETRNGEREISDQALSRVIELLSEPRYRLGLKDVEPDFLGRAYEYLLRKFAEGQGQSAGEFFTPKEVGWLIAHLVDPRQGEDVYDFACGSAGLLVKCELLLAQREKEVRRPLKLYGQELTGPSFAIANMNMVLHDMEGEIVRGNTMTNPKFVDGSGLERFDIVVANPMWNQDNIDVTTYENDPYARFEAGFAPAGTADWAWLQHAMASLKENGRAAVVLDTGAVSRGSGSQGENREKTIRKMFVDRDWVEAVILLPENLFYNTTAAGIIVVLRREKAPDRKGRVILINASTQFIKGRPKNELTDEGIRKVADAFQGGDDVEKLAKVVTLEEIRRKDFNLSPSAYVQTGSPAEHREIQPILDELAALDEKARVLDGELATIFAGLGFRWGGAE